MLDTRTLFASIFLKERLSITGKIGCLLSIIGAFIVVLHAPEDKEVTLIDELIYYALQPGKCQKKSREITNRQVYNNNNMHIKLLLVIVFLYVLFPFLWYSKLYLSMVQPIHLYTSSFVLWLVQYL